MRPVNSTAKILFYKSNNRLTEEAWIDWAIEMMEAGFETEHLIILAGIRPPFDEFEMRALTDKVLNELRLDYANQEVVTINYIAYLIDEALAERIPLLTVLRNLKDFYNELDMPSYLQDFALLYWAKDDLDYGEVQWYWPDANRANIDSIITQYLNAWKREHTNAGLV